MLRYDHANVPGWAGRTWTRRTPRILSAIVDLLNCVRRLDIDTPSYSRCTLQDAPRFTTNTARPCSRVMVELGQSGTATKTNHRGLTDIVERYNDTSESVPATLIRDLVA